MFTGIIQSVGHLLIHEKRGGDSHMVIATGFTDMGDVQLGDSIAVNGVCLTVTAITEDKISVDLSLETMTKTNAKNWQIDSHLNLEKSLAFSDKLGGHLVSGHIDAVGCCQSVTPSARSLIYEFKIPQNLQKYVVKKGSIGINGVSLTVNAIKENILSVNLIPHTVENTNLGGLKPGDLVNIEVDTIARYVEKMLEQQIIKK